MRRAQTLAAAAVAVALVGGAAYADRELGPDVADGSVVTSVASGGWYCPHGGGETDWEVWLQVANPGERPATIRVLTLGRKRPGQPQTLTVQADSMLTVPVPGEGRERASTVEWFDQWVAVGWVAHAGGGEGGVAAEPCAPAAGDRWSLPDGTTETERNDDHVVVMNPFARDAVFSVVLLSERQDPVVFGELTDLVLRGRRSRVIRLNEVVEGERTVAALVEVSVGRVVAGTLGLSTAGGIRSSIGYLGRPPEALTFPAGGDAGRTDLALMNAGDRRAVLEAELLGTELEQPFAGLADSAPPPGSARTYPATTSGPSSVVLTAPGPGLAAVRRTFGVVSDQGSSAGGAPASAWLILPAVAGSPSRPRLVLANPGSAPAQVTLSYLGRTTPPPIAISVPARGVVGAPKEFVEAAPQAAVLAVASSGTFIPAAASSSLGREGLATYAVSLGIPIPSEWFAG